MAKIDNDSENLTGRLEKLEEDLADQKNLIKERETNLFRAIRTLIEDLGKLQEGKDTDIKPALFGLLSAYMLPRIFLFVGGIGAFFFGLAQVLILLNQTEAMNMQSTIMEQQNLISTISLTPQLENILSTEPEPETVNWYYVTSDDAKEFRVRFQGIDMYSPENPSALAVIRQLSQNEKLLPILKNALIPLLENPSGSVATSAFRSLVALGVTDFDRVYIRNLNRLDLNLDGITIQDLRIESVASGEIIIRNCELNFLQLRKSNLAYVNLDGCVIDRIFTSFSGFNAITIEHSTLSKLESFASIFGSLNLYNEVSKPISSNIDSELEENNLYRNAILTTSNSEISRLNLDSSHQTIFGDSCVAENISARTTIRADCGCEIVDDINSNLYGREIREDDGFQFACLKIN